MNTSHGVDTPVLASCQCGDDPTLQLLRDLINGGMGQIDASRIAFGNHPSYRAPSAVWSVWVRVTARQAANRVRRELGLPQLSVIEVLR